MGRHQKIIALALGVSITVSIGGVRTVWAAPNNIQQQIDQIHNQQAQQKQSVNSHQSQLSEIHKKEAATVAKINQLNDKINAAAKKINTTQTDEKKTQAQIDRLKKNILATQKRIEKRKVLLEKRVRLMYKDGGSVQYLQVLLGSKNFSDFLDRAFALHLIASQDKGILDAQKADKKKEEKDKTKVIKSLKKLQNELDSLSSLKTQLNDNVRTENTLMSQLKKKGGKIKSTIQAEQQAIQSVQSKVSALMAQQQAAKQQAQQQPAANQTTTPVSRHHSVSTSAKTHSANNVNHSTSTSSASSVQSTPSSHASGSIAEMIQESKKWIGNSVYVWGGGRTQSSIQNGMFDCSGFVHWAYAQIGIQLGESTMSQRYEGTAVSASDMKPGDLLFFDTDGAYGHVGIYIGGGRFIGSQSSTGVAIASLSNPYWSRAFRGHVRRIIH